MLPDSQGGRGVKVLPTAMLTYLSKDKRGDFGLSRHAEPAEDVDSSSIQRQEMRSFEEDVGYKPPLTLNIVLK